MLVRIQSKRMQRESTWSTHRKHRPSTHQFTYHLTINLQSPSIEHDGSVSHESNWNWYHLISLIYKIFLHLFFNQSTPEPQFLTVFPLTVGWSSFSSANVSIKHVLQVQLSTKDHEWSLFEVDRNGFFENTQAAARRSLSRFSAARAALETARCFMSFSSLIGQANAASGRKPVCCQHFILFRLCWSAASLFVRISLPRVSVPTVSNICWRFLFPWFFWQKIPIFPQQTAHQTAHLQRISWVPRRSALRPHGL